MKKIFLLFSFLFILTSVSNQVSASITYSLDNQCGTSQLVVMVTPDINYSGGAASWIPAAFTIRWPMTLSSSALGTVTNQNGFVYVAQGSVDNDGAYYYRAYSHTAPNVFPMSATVSYEVARIALVGNVGDFGTFEIPASDNAWVIANNARSSMENTSGNQVVWPYGATVITNIPLFAGIFWDGTSWCGGNGTNGQPGTTDGAINCYINGLGAQLTTWNASVNQLQVATNSQLTILPGASLTAAGTVTINSAEGLIVAADATGTGSFINTITTIVYGGGGSAKVQAYMKNVATPGTFHTHLVGPLVKDPTYSAGGTGVYLSAFNLNSNDTYSYRYNEPTNTWINIWQLTDPVPTTAGIALSDTLSSSSVLSMTGQLATPVIATTTLSPWNPTTGGTGNGLYLFSNPFPSGLSLDEFNGDNTASNRFGGNITFYVWEDENVNYGTWTVDDLFGSTGTLGLEDANGIINPGQGFFGQRSGTGGIGFFADNRVHVYTPFLKSSQNNILKLQASGNLSKDEVVIRFSEGASEIYEARHDAEKWQSMYEYSTEISTISVDNYFLTTNTLPSLTSGQMVSVPMTFKCGAESEYIITASDFESFEGSTEIWLEDLKTGAEWHNLVDNPVYEFTAAPGDSENRFIVHFFSTTGIEDPLAEVSNVQIYAWGQDAYIVNRGNETIKEYVAYDMMGRELHRGTLPNSTVNKVQIGDVSAYYIVKVITREGTIYTDKVYITK